MLYSIERNQFVEDIPYKNDYRRWRERLTDDEFAAIETELVNRIDRAEIHTASWIPGNNWKGTPYEPIYTKACAGDPSESGKCFGLFLWTVLQQHADTWGFGRYEKNGVPLRGLTYFRLDAPSMTKR